jgi:RimJ/RimL family protein N-acetyltransferase
LAFVSAFADALRMSADPTFATAVNWRSELPVLTGRTVLLREPNAQDLGPLVDLLSLGDATRFGLDEPTSEVTVQQLIERVIRDRTNGVAFTYAITLAAARTVVGLMQVRQLDPAFEAAEWECTLAPSSRGSGLFVEAARLVGSFAFGSVGVHRLEARVLLQNGRANGALRKLGAVQEGILRRSMRRGSEYLDQVLWSMLKEDWGDHWVSTAPRVH